MAGEPEHRASRDPADLGDLAWSRIGTTLVAIAYVLVYMLPLGARPLFLPDEVRYAEIGREMISSGDWVVPRMLGLAYYEKPILGHWAQAASQLVFGETSFAVRFPSALSIGITAFLVFVMCRAPRRSEGPRPVGVIAAMILLTCLAVVGIGTFAILDSMLCLFIAVTLVAFFCASESDPGSRAEATWLVVAGVGCGLAFLTKGFLALVIPTVVVAPFLVWQRRYRDLLRMLWIPVLAASVVALPWSLWVYDRAPGFWDRFFWQENVERFLGDDADHVEPFWYFFLWVPLMALPWSLQVGSFWKGARRGAEGDAGGTALLRFAICWAVCPILFFSLARGKLLTYALPSFPAIALVMAILLDRYASTGDRRRFNIGAVAAAVLFFLILAGFSWISWVGVDGILVHAVSWGLKRDDILLFRSRGEFEYGLAQIDDSERYFSVKDAARLIAANPGRVVIFAKQSSYEKWGDHLPTPLRVIQDDPLGLVAAMY